jgi:hypothetical protein
LHSTRNLLSPLVALCFITISFAQMETATVSGRVTDQQGRSVESAEVVITNVDTNSSARQVSKTDGLYVLSGVKPGRYRISVTKGGFQTINLTNVVLNVQDSISQNFKLKVGSVSESITVVADSVNLNTSDASVSTVVDRNFTENLPMNGRSFQTLIQLTPGVVTVPSNPTESGQFSVNGQRASSNYWMVDGVSANIGIGMNASGFPGNGLAGAAGGFSVQGGTNSLVSVDALQEFRIQTSTYAPEFGRTPGGQISIATRSGANQFHGAAFDYLRNDLFDANDWFANNAGLHKPKERQNDFGGTFSGPLIKDKTFFFFSYEGLRLRLPKVALTTVPCDSTCKVFGSARTMAVPAMQPYFNAFPLPNGPEVIDAQGNSAGTAQFNSSFSDKSTLDAYSLRIDQNLGSSLRLFARYNYSPSGVVARGNAGFDSLSVLQHADIKTQTATVGATWVISPATFDDARFNYSRANSSGDYNIDNLGGAVPLTSLPFPSPITSRNGLFYLIIDSAQGGQLHDGQLGQFLQRQINIVDNLSVQKGSHSMKFGVDFRRLSPLYNPVLYLQLAEFADVPSTENGNLEFYGPSNDPSSTFLFRNLGFYAQDTWRILPRLTVTYGLRWDVDFVPKSLSGPSFPAVTGFAVNTLSNLALAPAGRPPFKTTYGNVAPRIGVAYQLYGSQEWQTVLRGGFGVFYDLATSEMGSQLTQGIYPFGATTFCCATKFPLTPAEAALPPITPPSASNPGPLLAFDPHLKLPYTLEWNVALEQSMGKQQTISVSYLGAVGRRLLQSAVAISPNPTFTGVTFVSNSASSDYNALQLQFQRRLSQGLQALGSYTWAHSIDTGSAGSSSFDLSNIGALGSNPNANRGPSGFDIRNALSAGVTYDIPAPKTSAFTSMIVRGWSLQSIVQVRSSVPVDVRDTHFFYLNGFFIDVRPDIVPGQPLYLYGSQYPGGRAFNPAAFTDPPKDPNGNPLRQGDLGRNALRGFGAWQWDFALHRDFPIHESLKVQFRAEMFNVLNHPTFGPPKGQFGRGGFGVSGQMLAQSLNNQNVGGGAFDPLYQIGGPRSIQFGLKLMF